MKLNANFEKYLINMQNYYLEIQTICYPLFEGWFQSARSIKNNYNY